MTMFRMSVCFVAGWLALAASPVLSGDLLLFRGPPPDAEDLADIMFPDASTDDQAPIRTRAIQFTDMPEVPGATTEVAPITEPTAVTVTPVVEETPLAVEAPVPDQPLPDTESVVVPEVVPVAEPEAPVIEAVAAEEEAPPVGDAVGFNITFGFDSATVQPESYAYLDRMGEMLNLAQAADRRVIIVGHTDAKGTDTYNLDLSERRAQSVRNYLVLRHKIEPSRLWPLGLGESQLLPGVNPDDGANRRVEFHPAS